MDSFFDRGCFVEVMAVVQVDVGGSEAGEAGETGFAVVGGGGGNGHAALFTPYTQRWHFVK